MPVRADPATPSDRAAWESLVDGSGNGTLFHRLGFLDYHPAERFSFRHLVFREGNEPVAVLPAALVPGDRGMVLRSPAGASFGGPVFARAASAAVMAETMEALVAWARSEGLAAVMLGPPPAFYWEDGDAPYLAALEAAGFRAQTTERTQVVPLDLPEEGLWQRLDRQARKAVRKAERAGIVVEVSHEWDAFYPVLEENRRARGAVPTHTREELRRLDKLLPGELRLTVARSGGEVVGGVLMVRANRRVALNFYLCYRADRQEDRPSDLLAWESLRWAAEQGFRYYDFGTSSLGGVLNPGLWRFKEKFGALDRPRVTYVRELIPAPAGAESPEGERA